MKSRVLAEYRSTGDRFIAEGLNAPEFDEPENGLLYAIEATGAIECVYRDSEDGRWYRNIYYPEREVRKASIVETKPPSIHRDREILMISALRRTCSGSQPPRGECVGFRWAGRNHILSMQRTRIGWLSPDGAWYPCTQFTHDQLAALLHSDGVPALEREGWCRVRGRTADKNGAVTIDALTIPRNNFTHAQAEVLLRYHEEIA